MATSGDEDDITDPVEEESLVADAAVGANSGDSEEDMYREAAAAVVRFNRPTTSYVQRVLRIGYDRAASMIERMEREGIISAVDDTGKRRIPSRDTARAADHADKNQTLTRDTVRGVEAAEEKGKLIDLAQYRSQKCIDREKDE